MCELRQAVAAADMPNAFLQWGYEITAGLDMLARRVAASGTHARGGLDMMRTLGPALACAIVARAGVAQTIYSNATASGLTSPGLATGATTLSGVAAPAGNLWSECPLRPAEMARANAVAGFTSGSTGASLRLADDFTIPSGQTWTITGVRLYAYSIASANPVTSATVQIWNARPDQGGAAVVFGDAATNRFVSASRVGIYRVVNTVITAGPSTTRDVYAIAASASVTLGPGTYWIDWGFAGASSVFTPPLTVSSNDPGRASWNAFQLITGTWSAIVDIGTPSPALSLPQDLPFELLGTVQTAPCYANCDGSTGTPLLSAQDFSCFLSRFRAGDSYANCDGSTDVPNLTAQDFSCFLSKFRAGCP